MSLARTTSPQISNLALRREVLRRPARPVTAGFMAIVDRARLMLGEVAWRTIYNPASPSEAKKRAKKLLDGIDAAAERIAERVSLDAEEYRPAINGPALDALIRKHANELQEATSAT